MESLTGSWTCIAFPGVDPLDHHVIYSVFGCRMWARLTASVTFIPTRLDMRALPAWPVCQPIACLPAWPVSGLPTLSRELTQMSCSKYNGASRGAWAQRVPRTPRSNKWLWLYSAPPRVSRSCSAYIASRQVSRVLSAVRRGAMAELLPWTLETP